MKVLYEKMCGDKSKRTYYFLLISAMVIAFVLQIVYLKQPAFGDQLDYFNTASNLPDVSPTHRHLRIGLVFPVWAAIKMFGYSEIAYYAIVLLSICALVGLTYVLGAKLFNKPVGFISSLWVLLNPYVFWDSSHLLPDIPSAALISAAVLCFIKGREREEQSLVSNGYYLFAGILFGWAYLVREYAIIAGVMVPLLMYVYKIPIKKAVLSAAGALAMFTVELVWGWRVYENPLIRIMSSIRPRETTRPYETNPVEILLNLPNFFLSRSFGMVYVILFFASILYGLYQIKKNRKGFKTLLAWGGTFWLFITLVGLLPMILFGEGRVLLRIHKFRYWMPLIVPLFIGMTATLYDMGNKIGQHLKMAGIGVIALIVVILPTSLGGMRDIIGSGAYIKNGGDHYHEMRLFLTDEGSRWDEIWVDEGHGRALSLIMPMYTKSFFGQRYIWNGEIKPLNDDERRYIDFNKIENGLVLIHPAGTEYNFRAIGTPLGVVSPPTSWKPVFISGNNNLIGYQSNHDNHYTLVRQSSEEWEVIKHQEMMENSIDVTRLYEKTIITLNEGDIAYAVDQQAGQLSAPVDNNSYLAAGTKVRGQIFYKTNENAPDRIIQPRIMLFDEAGSCTVRTPMYQIYEGDVELIEFAFEVPKEGTYGLRVMLDLRRSQQIILEDLTVEIYQ